MLPHVDIEPYRQELFDRPHRGSGVARDGVRSKGTAAGER
jgi:hypothetical protein